MREKTEAHDLWDHADTSTMQTASRNRVCCIWLSTLSSLRHLSLRTCGWCYNPNEENPPYLIHESHSENTDSMLLSWNAIEFDRLIRAARLRPSSRRLPPPSTRNTMTLKDRPAQLAQHLNDDTKLYAKQSRCVMICCCNNNYLYDSRILRFFLQNSIELSKSRALTNKQTTNHIALTRSMQ